MRIALHGWNAELADEEDLREQTLTRYVLREGIPSLLRSLLWTMFKSPVRFSIALVLAIRMMLGSQRSLPYHLAYLAEACRIQPWLESFGATHVHAHFGDNSAEIVMLAHTLGGPPYSFTIHGQDEPLFGGISEKVRRAAFVVAISSFGRSCIYRLVNHVFWHKIKVIHCGLENAFYNIAIVPPTTSPRLVCVGRLSKEKGQLLLIEAVHRLIEKGIKLELVLVGDGEMRAVIEKLISRYQLTDQVRITGWLSSAKVREEILTSRAMVLPSFSEGLPVVIMEAMALHRPALATFVGGIPELVIHGQNGWLIPAGDVDELETALIECLMLPISELESMGEQAYKRVLERHDIDREVAKLAYLFCNPIQSDCGLVRVND